MFDVLLVLKAAHQQRVVAQCYQTVVQALHYGWEDLEFARHRRGQQRIFNPPQPRAEVCLNIDCRQLGLGGNSCGPKPEAAYIFPIEKTSWSITLKPVRGSAQSTGDVNRWEELSELAR